MVVSFSLQIGREFQRITDIPLNRFDEGLARYACKISTQPFSSTKIDVSLVKTFHDNVSKNAESGNEGM